MQNKKYVGVAVVLSLFVGAYFLFQQNWRSGVAAMKNGKAEVEQAKKQLDDQLRESKAESKRLHDELQRHLKEAGKEQGKLAEDAKHYREGLAKFTKELFGKQDEKEGKKTDELKDRVGKELDGVLSVLEHLRDRLREQKESAECDAEVIRWEAARAAEETQEKLQKEKAELERQIAELQRSTIGEGEERVFELRPMFGTKVYHLFFCYNEAVGAPSQDLIRAVRELQAAVKGCDPFTTEVTVTPYGGNGLPATKGTKLAKEWLVEFTRKPEYIRGIGKAYDEPEAQVPHILSLEVFPSGIKMEWSPGTPGADRAAQLRRVKPHLKGLAQVLRVDVGPGYYHDERTYSFGWKR